MNTARAASVDAEIRAEREARAVDYCTCGHNRESHSEWVGHCCVGDSHCFSFKRATPADAALGVLRSKGLL